MKKGLLFLMLSVLTLGAWADDTSSAESPTEIADISTYTGTDKFVYSIADEKVYAYNSSGAYELYGQYLTVDGSYTDIDYIETTTAMGTSNVPYINTGYVHKSTTKIVMECNVTNYTEKNWMAFFGARNDSYKNNAMVMFWCSSIGGKNYMGIYNRSGNEGKGSTEIPTGQKLTITATGTTATIKKADNTSFDITTTGTANDGVNPMYIFDTNKGGPNGNNRDNSFIYMKLYSFKVYEGNTLIMDFQPMVNAFGVAGLRDKISGRQYTSASSQAFAKSAAGSILVPGYEGKIVQNSADNHWYQYTSDAWVDKGLMDKTAISPTDYKNMGNWSKDSGHASCFGAVTYSDDSNTFTAKGISGHENFWYNISTESNSCYHYSFKYSCNDWTTWANDKNNADNFMRALVLKGSNDYNGTEENGNSYGEKVRARYGLPHNATSDLLIEMDFKANHTSVDLFFQFGKVEDDKNLNWTFKNILVQKYTFPSAATYIEPVLPDYLSMITLLTTEVDAYDTSKTTTALATALSSANTTAKAITDSNTDQEKKAALDNLRTAYNNALAVDVSVLRPTVAYVKARGVNVSTQETFLETGTTNDVENQKNAAVIALKQHCAETSTQPTIFTMVSESVVGTNDNNYGKIVNDHADGFYVYNVGTGRWFCGGDDWGAHAAVGFPGIKVTTPKNDFVNGHYNSVITWLCNGNWGTYYQMAHNGYCDTQGESAAWKFWKQNADEGIYTWSRNGSNTGDNSGNGYGTKNLVGFAPSTYARVNTDRTDANDPYNQWIFVTEAQRDQMAAAAMATASESNPVDLTYKIKMPGFNQRERKEGTNQSSEELDWTCNHANYCYNASDNGSRKIIMGRGDNHADFVCDIYGYSWNDAFSWTQTVTGLTPGRYRVKVQGYNNGGDAANKAYLLANGQKATLVERSSESVLPWTSRLPENTFDNPEYFQVGCYWNEVLCNVGSNGELTLGVESPSVTGAHVVIFDNFRLEYVGTASESVSVGNLSYATYASDNALDFTDSSIKAFYATESAGTLSFTQVNKVPAGTGVLLYADGGATESVPVFTGAADAVTNNVFVRGTGAAVTYADNDQNYILFNFNGEDGIGFYKANNNTVATNRAYIHVANGSGVKGFVINLEDDATGISDLKDSKDLNDSKVIYNLAGQRLSKTQKGINIVNGKKILK